MGESKEWKDISRLRYILAVLVNANSEPASAEVLGKVADLSREDFQRAIKIADQGYRKYSTSTSFPERAAQLYRWYELVHANLEDCTSLNQK
jgi:acyl-CoA reductase-like NAD-dependent aldehyde dehydrogenase